MRGQQHRRASQLAKGESDPGDSLRPDEDGYSFDKFFIFENWSGEIQPNPIASEQDQMRADSTIQLWKLNRTALKTFRMQHDSGRLRPFGFIGETGEPPDHN